MRATPAVADGAGDVVEEATETLAPPLIALLIQERRDTGVALPDVRLEASHTSDGFKVCLPSDLKKDDSVRRAVVLGYEIAFVLTGDMS